jgi:GNAT superfamily N-acetyltransferase
MSKEIIVRRATEADLAALLDLYEHLHPEDSPLPPQAQLDNLWKEINANPLLHYFVVEFDGKLVSSCNLAVVPNLTRGARPYGVIENVVTHPDYRRLGFAQAVLEYALDSAWELDCYKVMLLSSAERDAAHCLYEKVGFKKGVKTGFVAKPEHGT